MFGQTLDIGEISWVSTTFFMLVAIVLLSWRTSRMSIRRAVIGSVSGILAWFIIAVDSYFSGDGFGVAIGALFGLTGVFVTVMAYREHKQLQGRNTGAATGTSVDNSLEKG